jgi:alkanesulfonate monooxygenase SsuD/methylene tetrahydromethanopterin reductase-like flavin-dependent oxidoreductase (luciferase family)
VIGCGWGNTERVKVFVEITRFAARATWPQLREYVTRLEDAAATGVTVADHLFHTRDDLPRSEAVDVACDPLTTLASIAGMSGRLEVQTVVANSAWIHPALLLRQFTQLAVLLGGERVTAGLGAGWSPEEFDALGLELPPFRARMDRLEEVLRFGRELYDTGRVSLAGRHVTARDLPLGPVPARPPALLVGGGSDRVLRMAGRYADVLDLHGDPRHGKVAGATMAEARRGDISRRVGTTVEDLAARIELVRDAAAEAGRLRDAVRVGSQIFFTAYGSGDDVRAAEEELCAKWAGIAPRRLDRNPYLLFGTPAQMAEALAERRERYGLERISLGEAGLPRVPADPVRFCREVLPLLGTPS